MGAECIDFFYVGFYVVPVAKNLYLFLSVQDFAAKCVFSHVAYNQDDVVGVGDVVGKVALEYRIEAKGNGQECGVDFIGYSYFITERGVYRNNVMWTDEEIEAHFSMTELQETKSCVEKWLENNVVGEYVGPLGVDLLICRDNSVHVSELNFRHTMGMVAHSRILRSKSKNMTTK